MRLFLPGETNEFANPRLVNPANGIAAGFADYHTLATTVTYTCLEDGWQRIRYTGQSGDNGSGILLFYVAALSAVTAGDTLALSAQVRATGSGISCTLNIVNQGYADIAASAPIALDGVERTVSVITTAPAGTTGVSFLVKLYDVVEDDTIDLSISEPKLVKSSILTPYFSGDSPDCSWSGTPNASVSVRAGSDLRYPVGSCYGADGTGTVAARVTPLFGSADSVPYRAFVQAWNSVATANRSYLWWDVSQEWMCLEYDGTNAPESSGVTAFLANSAHTLVARHSGTKLDLNYDGTDAAQANDTATLTGLDTIGIGGWPLGSHDAYAYIGPVLISPQRKSDAWVAAIQADDGVAFDDINRLKYEFMEPGDMLLPLVSDGQAWVKGVWTP